MDRQYTKVIPAVMGNCCQNIAVRLVQLGIISGTPVPPSSNYELREDGDNELREDGDFELREN